MKGGGGGAYCLEVYVVWNKDPGILRGLGGMLPWIFFLTSDVLREYYINPINMEILNLVSIKTTSVWVDTKFIPEMIKSTLQRPLRKTVANHGVFICGLPSLDKTKN